MGPGAVSPTTSGRLLASQAKAKTESSLCPVAPGPDHQTRTRRCGRGMPGICGASAEGRSREGPKRAKRGRGEARQEEATAICRASGAYHGAGGLPRRYRARAANPRGVSPGRCVSAPYLAATPVSNQATDMHSPTAECVAHELGCKGVLPRETWPVVVADTRVNSCFQHWW